MHNQKISYKDYNNEVALRYVVKDTLFGIQKYYLPPFDELPSGKGIADVVYIPKPQFGHNKPYIIIELKWDKSASDAMQQIIDKGYAEKFLNEKRKVLLVGINYDSKTKEHQVEIKKLN